MINLGLLLRKPFQQIVTELHEHLGRKGFEEVREAHGNVFQFIGDKGSRITQMAEKAQMTKQSMSYLVEYLEKRGYVERFPDPEDKRAVMFRLTEQGWTTVNHARDGIVNTQERWREKMGTEKFDKLAELLQELNAIMKKEQDERA